MTSGNDVHARVSTLCKMLKKIGLYLNFYRELTQIAT